ncbi:helix-hairpin-helix domain-containing protein [Arthrobacter sp. efr-133-R2A-120]|uniref:helix-hairpin-helix domain-containing protein n=1 Tax=Arthrobacter sp. efr-133-R2A-120 TaxID=3040277 RepID=UPI00254E28F9|nr:helix-hairpin-helix domain-containing protein [Arthrobacter sp. efr-133-R2A-120]
MPRRNRASPADDAASAARLRFAVRLAPTSDEEAVAKPRHDNKTEPLLPMGTLMASASDMDDAGAQSATEDLSEEAGSPSRLRWRTPWRVAVLLSLPCLLLVVWFFWQSWSGQPMIEPLVRGSHAGGTPEAGTGSGKAGVNGAPESPNGAQLLIVHVAGAVKNPGIVRVPAGARVFDAIAAAGGADPAAELDSLNLAAVVEDSAKIHVPRIGEAAPSQLAGPVGGGPTAGGTGAGTSAGGKVNLNTATAEELDTLPKVGPVLAKRIVEWRQQHGPFASVEDLDAVDGVGPKMMESLLPLVTV